jgi:(2Fe-2S) ferredoxin
MTPTEVYVYLDAVKQPMMYGTMSQDDVDELIEMHETEGCI